MDRSMHAVNMTRIGLFHTKPAQEGAEEAKHQRQLQPGGPMPAIMPHLDPQGRARVAGQLARNSISLAADVGSNPIYQGG